MLEKVTTKLYKHDASGDLQERQYSISYTVLVTTARSHIEQPPVNAGNEVVTPAHSHIVQTLADMGTLGSDTVRPTLIDIEGSITDAGMAYEKLQLASWEPLLRKVEKFNELMRGITEVTRLHQITMNHHSLCLFICVIGASICQGSLGDLVCHLQSKLISQ